MFDVVWPNTKFSIIKSKRDELEKQEPPAMSVVFSPAGVLAVGQDKVRVLWESGFYGRFRAKFIDVDRVLIDVENFQDFCAFFCAKKNFFVLFKKRKNQRKEYMYLFL